MIFEFYKFQCCLINRTLIEKGRHLNATQNLGLKYPEMLPFRIFEPHKIQWIVCCGGFGARSAESVTCERAVGVLPQVVFEIDRWSCNRTCGKVGLRGTLRSSGEQSLQRVYGFGVSVNQSNLGRNSPKKHNLYSSIFYTTYYSSQYQKSKDATKEGRTCKPPSIPRFQECTFSCRERWKKLKNEIIYIRNQQNFENNLIIFQIIPMIKNEIIFESKPISGKNYWPTQFLTKIK